MEVAAALKTKSTIQIPESQPSVAAEPQTTVEKRTTPDRGQGSKSKKVPPKANKTPDKTKEVDTTKDRGDGSKSSKVQPKRNTPPDQTKGQKSRDDDDFSSPEDAVRRETRRAATGNRLQLP